MHFDEFVNSFLDILTQPQFRAGDFLHYLERPAPRRAGDEASVVDNAIVSPLLGLLGFSPGSQIYNQNKKNGRPDFAPEDADYGVCFVVENKSTGIDLALDLTDPDSHISQLSAYLRSLGLRSGWLTNGRRLTIWRFDHSGQPHCALDLDVPAIAREWKEGGIASLSSSSRQGMRLIWEQFSREAFTDFKLLERELATEIDEWRQQALPLGGNPNNQELFVGAVKTLLRSLQADARRLLDDHLKAAARYEFQSNRINDDDLETADARLSKLRRQVSEQVRIISPLVGMTDDEEVAIQNDLEELRRDPLAFLNTKGLMAKTLAVINAARERKFPSDKKAARAWSKYDNGLGPLGDALKSFGDLAFEWHKRKGLLRHDNRESIEVRENYGVWTAVVQETMLGGLDEDGRRNEFALQAAYVVFIRLLLIRVCEDKGILRNRFLSDGGLKHWQEDIERYLQFANGNPYEPLLDMAFRNAQNIYAHFFTGRELFNWYALDRQRFIRVLYQLSRFNFEDVDSDLIGTIYNTYVERPEKKQKGQYYTPPEIVQYILDETGYVTGPGIVGPGKRLIDPACGSGSFLVEAARRLIASYKSSGGENPRQLADRVRDNLYGFDLNPFACYLAEVNLLIQVLDLVKLEQDGKHAPRLNRFHIYNVDALAPASGILYYARANTLMAEELDVVDQIKGRQGGYTTGFGWVVANPPYGAALTDMYKRSLRDWMADVFYGKPDTYVFFLRLGIGLLGTEGRLGFITPNTYLMGTNTVPLREQLLNAGRIEQVVDLPQGIWKDVNVDCALLFLVAESDSELRRGQVTQVFSMDVRDSLDKLTKRQWKETFTQTQSTWIDDPDHEMNIRWTPLLSRIEEACRTLVDGGPATHIQRLRDVCDRGQGIIIYKTREDSSTNLYIKPQREVPSNSSTWKPLLDGSSHVGRYSLRWSPIQPHLNYGNWLWRARDQRFFDSPKLVLVRLRNRALRRRLVATYDNQKFYHRDNYNDIISSDQAFDLKYVLALFNSSLLNYWYARRFDNVNINPDTFEQLPIRSADTSTQADFVRLVDVLLEKQSTLNALRDKGYGIRTTQEGTPLVEVPYDVLLKQLRDRKLGFPVLTLFDARAAGLIRLPDQCDLSAQISRVFVPSKSPGSVVLRTNQLWLEVDDHDVRRFLLNYLARPQWKGKSWNETCGTALLPESPAAYTDFFAEEDRLVAHIEENLRAIASADSEIDARVLDLYGILDSDDRQKILGSAPAVDDEELEVSVLDAEVATVTDDI